MSIENIISTLWSNSKNSKLYIKIKLWKPKSIKVDRDNNSKENNMRLFK